MPAMPLRHAHEARVRHGLDGHVGQRADRLGSDRAKPSSRRSQRALAWFETVERICTRFDPNSEVMQLLGKRRPAGAGQHAAVRGRGLRAGPGRADRRRIRPDHRRDARTTRLQHQLPHGRRRPLRASTGGVSFRDVRLDRRARTILLRKPLVLDLNAVAKGLAIDLAVQELRDLPTCASRPAATCTCAAAIRPASCGTSASSIRAPKACWRARCA